MWNAVIRKMPRLQRLLTWPCLTRDYYYYLTPDASYVDELGPFWQVRGSKFRSKTDPGIGLQTGSYAVTRLSVSGYQIETESSALRTRAASSDCRIEHGCILRTITDGIVRGDHNRRYIYVLRIRSSTVYNATSTWVVQAMKHACYSGRDLRHRIQASPLGL